jgi:hypothetical protein
MFEVWYAGNSQYTGMRQLYDTIRANDPNGIIIIGGRQEFALDGTSGIGFYLKYNKENNTYPTNIIWNILPFFGQGQGLERSIRSIMRFALSLKTIGPVIFTEVRQHCCGAINYGCYLYSCNDDAHGDHYVYNILNMCEQYDISWIGWGWRGNNNNTNYSPCVDGQTVCYAADMRDVGGVLTNGSSGGANWKHIWNTFVNANVINVNDNGPGKIDKLDVQLQGFLPRPCIVGTFGLGDNCGYDLNTNVKSLKFALFTQQTINNVTLPGLPPNGNCANQGCQGYVCSNSNACN